VPLKPYTVNYQELNIPDIVVVAAVNKNKSEITFFNQKIGKPCNLKVFDSK